MKHRLGLYTVKEDGQPGTLVIEGTDETGIIPPEDGAYWFAQVPAGGGYMQFHYFPDMRAGWTYGVIEEWTS